MSDLKSIGDELSEEEITAAIRRSVEALKEQGLDSRDYAPVLINQQTGEIVDGNSRLGIDDSWPVIKVELSPTQAEIVKFQLNFARRRMKREQIVEGLSRIAEQTGWTPQEIAENLGIPSMTIYRYLPRRFKNKKRGRQPGETPYYPGSVKRERTIKELEEKLEEAEATEEKLVSVIIREQPERNEPKNPEQVAEEVYGQFPTAPPRFVQAALRRSHPSLTEEERKEIVESLRPEQDVSRIESPLGFRCPACGAWKRRDSMKRALTELEKSGDSELVEIVLIRLRRQGWKA